MANEAGERATDPVKGRQRRGGTTAAARERTAADGSDGTIGRWVNGI